MRAERFRARECTVTLEAPQSEHPFQALLEARQVVPGQAHDQVGVDVVKAQPLGQLEGFRNVLGGVAAADVAKHLVRQGLGIDTDAADARLPQGQELLPGDGVRAAGLHGELRAAGEIKHMADLPAQGGKLPGGQGGGGAPPMYTEIRERPRSRVT